MQNYMNLAEMNILNVCCHQKTTYIFYGIEEHLKQFRDSDQFKILYDSWIIEKEMYKKRLSTVGMTYQTYSLHDASHAEAILRQIAYFLGEDRVRQLSPTDAWLILESAYCHDLGMVVSAQGLYEDLATMTEEEFDDISKKMYEKESYHIREAWNYLEPLFRDGRNIAEQKLNKISAEPKRLWETESMEKDNELESLRSIYHSKWYEWPVYFTKAFRLLIEEHCRPKHAKMSYQIISHEAEDKTYEGLIPLRLRQLIAEIAVLHMEEREHIIQKLNPEVLGFAGDYAHPRYIAELIRIGDLLDMDNNRFNKYQLAVAGNDSYISFTHQLKHMALRDFLVTSKKIKVVADFVMKDAIKIIQGNGMNKGLGYSDGNNDAQNEENDLNEKALQLAIRAMKEMNGWLEMLHKEIDFFSKNWYKIVPDGLIGSCPYFEPEKLLLDGKEIDRELLDLRYEITLKRSSEIIQGGGLYEDIFLAFIREIIQNSMDAVKRRVYRDLQRKSDKEFCNPLEFYEYILRDFEQLAIQVKCTEETCEAGDDKAEYDRRAIKFEIRDYGIGISQRQLTRMQFIGDIKDYKTSQFAKEMPFWWKPTGSFGIGMQSIFNFSKNFKLTTRTEKEKQLRKMQFYSTLSGGKIESYIKEDEDEAKTFGYGTSLEVTIPVKILESFQKRGNYGIKSDYFGNMISVYKEKVEETIAQICGSFGIPVVMLEDENKDAKHKKAQFHNLNLRDLKIRERLAQCFGNYFIDLDPSDTENEIPTSRVKVVNPEKKQYQSKGFSCWSASNHMLLRYRWTTEGSKDGSIKVFFNEIRVDDIQLIRNLIIPFFDVEIYLFDENAENYLEVNRDYFLYETRSYIENMINSTHLSCLRFLLEPEEDGKLPQEKLAIWKEDDICRDNVREYFEYLLYGKVMTRLVQGVHCFIQNAANIYHLSDSAIANEIVSKDSDLWLTDAGCKYIGDVHLVKGEQIGVRYIIEDLFLPYMELAVTEMVCMREEYGDYTVIYKAGARTGAPLSLSFNSFRSYIRMRYSELHDKDNESPRMILPGIEDYRVLCVVRLQDNLGSVFEKKWNSAIIMPLTQNEWKELVEKVEEEKKAEAARIQKDTKKTGGKARTEEEIVQSMINKAYINDSNSSYVEIVKYILSNGISRDATKDRINNAYRRLLMQIWKIFH